MKNQLGQYKSTIMIILNKTPTVSIILPVYNGENSVLKSIQSVVQQSYLDWELIVVDDASTDASVDQIRTICQYEDRIQLIQLQRNSGAAVARNTAIQHAQGRYIAFLDSDDLWLPSKLERQLTFMQQSNTAFSYTAYGRIHESGKILTAFGVPVSIQYQDLLKTNYIGCLTAIYDTQIYGKRFMPLNRQGQDYALWLDLLRSGKEAKGINEVLAYYQIRLDSLSAKKITGSTYIWNVYRNLEHFSLLKTFYYFAHYSVRGLMRRTFPNLALSLGLLHGISCDNSNI
jgi:teichuronic acid biosynthesis glycosyltransferase TuaG